MRLSDYVAKFIADLGIQHVFSVAGGGSQYLTDSLHERLHLVATHHEQAAAMAAEAYARIDGLGCALVTTGPGGTNAITGVACAWVDSIPVLFISGQVTRNTMMEGTGLRQNGIQESGIVTLVASITKYAVCVKDERDIRFELEKAAFIARSGRPGPVWIDIPLDIQAKEIDPQDLLGFGPYVSTLPPLTPSINKVVMALEQAKRPVLILGNGVRGAQKEAVDLVETLYLPVVTSWSGADLIGSYRCHIGHCGLFGDRGANLTVQNADLLLVIGCRLSMPQTGYDRKAFAPNAEIIMVDIDPAEARKLGAFSIQADARVFIDALLDRNIGGDHVDWMLHCCAWRNRYPVVLPEYAQSEAVNSYYFVQALSGRLPADATVVLDMGTAFTGTYQAAVMQAGQRWITAGGHAPMGYGLPGAVGAAFATGRKVVCIVGDGAFQFNIHELATIAHHNLPILIFVLCNGGYLTMKHSQLANFGRFAGAEREDLSFPDVRKIAAAYEIPCSSIRTTTELHKYLGNIMEDDGPLICEIQMDPMQPLIPRVQSKKLADGILITSPLHDMWPHLPADELAEQMK